MEIGRRKEKRFRGACGDIGENLHAKYQAKTFLILESVFEAIFDVLKNNFNEKNDNSTKIILESSEKWLKNLYLIDAIMGKNFETKDNYKLEINFDFPEWLKKSDLPFNDFQKNTTYQLDYDFKKINYIKNEIKTVQGGDKERALGRYLDRRNMIGFDLFEKTASKIY